MRLIDAENLDISFSDIRFVDGIAYVPLTIVKSAIRTAKTIDVQSFKDQEREEIFNCIKGCYGDDMGNAIIKSIKEVH